MVTTVYTSGSEGGRLGGFKAGSDGGFGARNKVARRAITSRSEGRRLSRSAGRVTSRSEGRRLRLSAGRVLSRSAGRVMSRSRGRVTSRSAGRRWRPWNGLTSSMTEVGSIPYIAL